MSPARTSSRNSRLNSMARTLAGEVGAADSLVSLNLVHIARTTYAFRGPGWTGGQTPRPYDRSEPRGDAVLAVVAAADQPLAVHEDRLAAAPARLAEALVARGAGVDAEARPIER